MRRPLLIIPALGACLLLAGYSAGVQTHVAAGAAPAGLAQALASETHRRLSAEFQQQSVAFDLAGTRVWAKEGDMMRVRAEGTADFGADGQAATSIEAVYDRGTGQWVTLDYQLL